MPEPLFTIPTIAKGSAVLLAFGVAWGSLTFRVGNLEDEHATVDALPVQIATITANQEHFKEQIGDIKSALGRIEGKIDNHSSSSFFGGTNEQRKEKD